MKCLARIEGANASWSSELPHFVKQCSDIWAKKQTEQAGTEILEILSGYFKAKFLPISIDELADNLEDDSDIDAIEVIPFAFDFNEDGSIVIGAYAVFEVPFKSHFTKDMVASWESEDSDSLTWCVSFYWDTDEDEVYLDIDYDSLSFEAVN
jgi:hypothetical protein